jgi:hypothetical protein
MIGLIFNSAIGDIVLLLNPGFCLPDVTRLDEAGDGVGKHLNNDLKSIRRCEIESACRSAGNAAKGPTQSNK